MAAPGGTRSRSNGGNGWIGVVIILVIVLGLAGSRKDDQASSPAQTPSSPTTTTVVPALESADEPDFNDRIRGFVVVMFYAVVIVALGAVAVVAVLRAVRIRPDRYGQLPVPRRLWPQVALDTYGARADSLVIKAGAQFPEGVGSLAVHHSVRNDQAALEAPPPDEYDDEMADAPAPTYAELRAAGQLPPPDRLGLAWADQLVTYDWDEVAHIVIAGRPGGGKSNDGAFLGAQAYEQGAAVVLLDPQAAQPQSVTRRMETAGAQVESIREPVDALKRMKEIVAEMDRRGKVYEPDAQRIVVIIDERRFWERHDRNGEFAELIAAVMSSGRKARVHIIWLGQHMTADSVGGTEGRSISLAYIIHNIAREQARLLCSDIPGDVGQLQRGWAYIVVGGDLVLGQIPECPPAPANGSPMLSVVPESHSPRSSQFSGQFPPQFGSSPGGVLNAGSGTTHPVNSNGPRTGDDIGVAPEPKHRVDTILRAKAQEKSTTAISRTLWPDKSAPGAQLIHCNERIDAVIAWALNTGYRPDGLPRPDLWPTQTEADTPKIPDTSDEDGE